MPRFRELHNICYEGLHAKKYPYREDNQLLEIATVNGSKRQALLNNRITDWVGRIIPNDKVRTPLEDLPLQTYFTACKASFFSGTFPSTWRGALGVKTRPGQQNIRVDIVWSHIIATCRHKRIGLLGHAVSRLVTAMMKEVLCGKPSFTLYRGGPLIASSFSFSQLVKWKHAISKHRGAFLGTSARTLASKGVYETKK